MVQIVGSTGSVRAMAVMGIPGMVRMGHLNNGATCLPEHILGWPVVFYSGNEEISGFTTSAEHSTSLTADSGKTQSKN